jgi:integrase
VRDRTILIEQAAARGEIKSTKTSQTRTVGLLAPLVADLGEWRLACGRPDPDALVFRSADGGPWSHADWGNWRNRIFGPAARAAGFEGSRPYDLRHSFCSLLIHEGRSLIEVARQLGHSPTMTLNTYGHVFDEFEGGERMSAEAHVRGARDELVSVLCPSGRIPAARTGGAGGDRPKENPA